MSAGRACSEYGPRPVPAPRRREGSAADECGHSGVTARYETPTRPDGMACANNTQEPTRPQEQSGATRNESHVLVSFEHLNSHCSKSTEPAYIHFHAFSFEECMNIQHRAWVCRESEESTKIIISVLIITPDRTDLGSCSFALCWWC